MDGGSVGEWTAIYICICNENGHRFVSQFCICITDLYHSLSKVVYRQRKPYSAQVSTSFIATKGEEKVLSRGRSPSGVAVSVSSYCRTSVLIQGNLKQVKINFKLEQVKINFKLMI